MKPNLVWRRMSVKRADRARIFRNGREEKGVVACGPFWIERFIRHDGRLVLNHDGSGPATELMLGIVRWLPLEESR